jgi:class 3 adenylate cyclase
MIGDAILAWFHGADVAARAVDAAAAIQVAIRSSGLPRGIGIGLYSGPVVAGLIGSGDRLAGWPWPGSSRAQHLSRRR